MIKLLRRVPPLQPAAPPVTVLRNDSAGRLEPQSRGRDSESETGFGGWTPATVTVTRTITVPVTSH